MERLDEILSRSNYTASTSERTEEEWEKWKVDCLNESEGKMHEKDGYICDICHNKGYIMRVEKYNGHWTTVSRECKCMKTRKCIRRMQRSGLKDIIKDYTFEKYEASEQWQKGIKEKAVAYAANPEGWFFIGGQSGAGKTHICTAICREFLLNGKEVIYMLWRDDVVKLKSLANDAEKYDEQLDRFKDAEVLYIDDLFKTGRGQNGEKQHPTGADVNVAFQLMNYRYNKKLPTIISSECTVDDLMDIDEAIGGRIFEKSVPISIKPDRSRNYRMRKVINL